MTTVCFLSSDLSILYGPIDQFLSLVWTESYKECGSYSLVLPMTKEIFSAASAAEYIALSERPGLGRVEKICFSTDYDAMDEALLYGVEGAAVGGAQNGTLTISGRMAESILADRIISRGSHVSGGLLEVILTTLLINAIGAFAGTRQIPLLTFGELIPLVDEDGNAYTIDDAPSGKALDVWLREALAIADASYRILPHYETGELVFTIYRGLDRRGGQNENAPCTFSTSFDSVGALQFVYDKTEYKNYAFIAGEGEGNDRVTATLDLRRSENEPIRELFVDARDLRSTEGSTTESEEAYTKLLLARGRKKLSEHGLTECVSGKTLPTALTEQIPPADTLPPVGVMYGPLMRAGVDYSLGDLCDIASDTLDIVWSARISEIVYTYEGRRCFVEVRFGDGYPDMKTYIQRIATSWTDGM